jgi:hypothetical protein
LNREPRTDSLTRLSTGSLLLKLGHSDSAQQVILGRPNFTVINVILSTRVRPSDHPPSELQTAATRLARLNWLATLVEQKLDYPSSDIG